MFVRARARLLAKLVIVSARARVRGAVYVSTYGAHLDEMAIAVLTAEHARPVLGIHQHSSYRYAGRQAEVKDFSIITPINLIAHRATHTTQLQYATPYPFTIH